MLVEGGGGGWSAVTGGTYQIKTMAVPAVAAGGMTASQVEALFSTLDPSAVAQAGEAHTQAARTLKTIADNLVTHAQKLSGGWSGTAAQHSVAAIQQLHQTTIQLAQASAQTGQVLTWLGQSILPYYKNWKAPSNGIVGTVESWFGSNPQDTAAQQVMQRLNDRLSQANAALPPSVSFNPPKIGAADHSPATSSGTGPSVAAGPAVAGVGLTGGTSGVRPGGPGSGGVTGVAPGAGVGPGGLGHLPGGPGTNIPAPAPTHLAGLPPGPGPGPGTGTVPTLPGGPAPGGGGGIPPGTGPGGPVPVGIGPAPGEGGGPPPPGTVPGEGEPPPLGTVPGEGGEPPPPGTLPGDGTVPGEGPVPGEGTIPGEGPVPGGGPLPGGSLGGEAGVGSGPGGSVGTGTGSGSGGEGLIGEDVPGEGAVMGSDGMIGTGPGMGGIADGEFGPGNTGATGFVGADDAATDTGGGDFPMSGGTGNGRRENERYRQAWMAQDADIWEGETKVSPSLIGS